MQTSLFFDEPEQPAIKAGCIDGIIQARAIYNGGSGFTRLRTIETINEHLSLCEVLDFLNGNLSSRYQIVDTVECLCVRPGDDPDFIKSDFMRKYDRNTYQSKLNQFKKL